jgi:hypothetical protein
MTIPRTARILLPAVLLIVLPAAARAQPTYKLGVYTHVQPTATLKLDGSQLSRSDVKDDPGFRLQYHFLKDGKELTTIDARAQPQLSLPHKESGTYAVVLEVFYPAFKGSGQKGQFVAVSNTLYYRLEAADGGTVRVVLMEERDGWRRTPRP